MLILYAIIYGSFITYIHAQQNPTTFFIEPPAASQAQLYFDNKAYVVGDTLNVKWVTDQEDYTVCLWQQNAQTVVASVSLQCIYTKHTNQSEQGGFPWKVGPNEFDLSVSYIFFLTLGPYASLSNATTSHYFNMTYPNAAASSSATPTLTTSTSLTSQSTTLDAMAPPSSSTSTPATPAKSLDIALPVGLAVGLGVPVIALLAFVAFKKNKHKAKNSGGAESSHLSNGLPSDARSSQPVFGELPGYSKQPVNAINASSPPRPRPVGDMMPVEMHAP